MLAIEVFSLTKKFNEFKAIDNVSFSVKEGEIFGMLGPNGAGKTTTIRILSTILKPTEGKAFVWGYDVVKQPDRVRRSIGIVFQDQALDDRLTGLENLDFHARLYGMKKELRRKRIKEVLHLVDLWEKRNTLVKYYSGARGLMHYPKVLFLDEPTLGLDAQTRRKIWEHVKILNKREKIAILLTTHYMDEAELCQRVGFLSRGRLIALDSPDQLKRTRMRGQVLEITTDDPDAAMKLLLQAQREGTLPLKEVALYGAQVHAVVPDAALYKAAIAALLQRAGIEVVSVEWIAPTLEDVFISAVKGR